MEHWDIIGHDWAVQLLQGHLSRDRLGHAYLFTGPQGIGRRTLAIRFAQAINCPQPAAVGVPCHTCRTCRQIEQLAHPDLTLLHPEEPGKLIKVGQVREMQHNLILSPYQAKYRIALITQFELANPAAQNALLKTLEEPPAQVILLLTATSAEALLPTITSRCEVLPLRPVAIAQIDSWLAASHDLAPEQANLLAHISAGRPGVAVHLHENPDQLEARHGWLTDLFELLPADRVTRFAYAEALAKDPTQFQELLQVWISIWRDILLTISTNKGVLANIDHQDKITEIASSFRPREALQVITNLDNSLTALNGNANTRLAAEVMLLNLPRT